MLMDIQGGSNVALITPMTPQLEVDYSALEKLLEWHVESNTNGIVILGTTGEGSTITMEERTKIIQTSVSCVGGRIPIIVGTGTVDPVNVLELTRNAKENGADASLIITPYYVKPPQRALIKHFTFLADAISLPMILYNCPGRTGIDMSTQTIETISKHPGIIGVKDASGDLNRVEPMREAVGKDFLMYSGEDDQGCEYVTRGGDGVISVTANVCPALESEMLALAYQGDTAAAKHINNKLIPVHKNMFIESNPIPAKAALRMMGRVTTGIRAPLCELDPACEGAVMDALKGAGAL